MHRIFAKVEKMQECHKLPTTDHLREYAAKALSGRELTYPSQSKAGQGRFPKRLGPCSSQGPRVLAPQPTSRFRCGVLLETPPRCPQSGAQAYRFTGPQ